MPPKIKITKEAIVDTALEIIRTQGLQAVNARAIAAALQCSTQPVFSNFATMEALHIAVLEKANALCGAYIRREIESDRYPAYKASGMAYIRFAKEEKALFKLLYMRDRTGDPSHVGMELGAQMETMVASNTGLQGEAVQLFHLEMWAFVHGIATMYATDFVDLPWELVSNMLTDAYQGLRKQYGME